MKKGEFREYLVLLIIFHLARIEAVRGLVRKFVVTGATGALGSSLCGQIVKKYSNKFDDLGLCTEKVELFLGYRSEDRLKRTLVQLEQEMKDKSSQERIQITPFSCDFATGCSVERTMIDLNVKMCSEPIQSSHDLQEHLVLINNAANCLKRSSPQALQRSLDVNAIFPYRLARSVLLHGDCKPDTSVTIVNISSQDGDLSYLHSDLVEHLGRLDSKQAWEEYVERERTAWRGSDFEYAFGETPLYSFSKAVFNAATKLLSQEVEAAPGRSGERRVIAMCPGNVLSQMSTEEERITAISPTSASELVLRVASDATAYRNGQFCRVNGGVIECGGI